MILYPAAVELNVQWAMIIEGGNGGMKDVKSNESTCWVRVGNMRLSFHTLMPPYATFISHPHATLISHPHLMRL